MSAAYLLRVYDGWQRGAVTSEEFLRIYSVRREAVRWTHPQAHLT